MRDAFSPAFPCEGGPDHYRGMTLRDWFAGQALASGVVWGLSPSAVGPITPEQVAEAHYRAADAMLAERAKR